MPARKYFYREPTYQPNVYQVLAFVKNNKGDNYFYPILNIYTNLTKLRLSLNKVKAKIEKAGEQTIYGAVVLSLSLAKTVPLKKEYWSSHPKSLLDEGFRFIQYLNMMKDVVQLYRILVLPRYYSKIQKKWDLVAWIPVLMSIDGAKLDNLMITSDQPVDCSAKTMALYSVIEAKGLNLDTGELFEPKKDSQDKLADC